jgi:nucleoside-diphosphate-sugar epimerase
LERLGVDVVLGDLTDRASIVGAVEGVDGVVHTAAVLGGTWAEHSPDEFLRTIYDGSVHVLDAAQTAGVPVVLLSTYGIFVFHETITETSRPWPVGTPDLSPYLRAKLATFHEGMARVWSGAQEIMFVVPGCIYGPSLFPQRALDPTSFDSALLRGLTGGLERYVTMPMLWCTADDVAAISLEALSKGRSGRRYLALGSSGESMSLAAWCNLAAELAGVQYRVEDEDPSASDTYRNMSQHARRVHAEPLSDSSGATTELGYEPTTARDGLRATVEWFRDLGLLPPPDARPS